MSKVLPDRYVGHVCLMWLRLGAFDGTLVYTSIVIYRRDSW